MTSQTPGIFSCWKKLSSRNQTIPDSHKQSQEAPTCLKLSSMVWRFGYFWSGSLIFIIRHVNRREIKRVWIQWEDVQRTGLRLCMQNWALKFLPRKSLSLCFQCTWRKSSSVWRWLVSKNLWRPLCYTRRKFQTLPFLNVSSFVHKTCQRVDRSAGLIAVTFASKWLMKSSRTQNVNSYVPRLPRRTAGKATAQRRSVRSTFHPKSQIWRLIYGILLVYMFVYCCTLELASATEALSCGLLRRISLSSFA